MNFNSIEELSEEQIMQMYDNLVLEPPIMQISDGYWTIRCNDGYYTYCYSFGCGVVQGSCTTNYPYEYCADVNCPRGWTRSYRCNIRCT